MATIAADKVMGQSGQAKIHPFFGQFPQYHVVDSASGRDPPAIDSGHRRSEPETAPCQPTADVRDGTPRRESSPRSSELLEEDPNAARRKRLKTSPEPTPVAEQARDDEPKSTLHAPEARDSSAQQAESVHNTPPENAAAQPGSRPQTPTKETHPPKKVIKLNANGKLLSSPPAPRTENKPQRKGREKRKSSPEKTPKSKLVIFRYGEDRVSKEAVKMLNEILAGRQRYSPIWRRHFAPKPAGDSKPKPTHPFFLKKVPRQPAEQSPITENADEKKMSQKSSSAKSGAERVWQSSRPEGEFTKSLFPKQPDLVDPLWPPKGMVHIRDGVETPRAGDIPTSATDNQRKDKVTAVDVLDTENLLLTEYSPCRDSEPSILRPPGRNVMLCEELQKEVGNRLSHTPAEADDDTPSLGSHPSLRRLYHSVKTHLSAFDIGESETRQWVNKYAPTCANDVLQAGPEVRMLRDWLKQLMVSSVDTGRASSKDRQTKRRKKKRRKAADKLDGFIVSSDEEASEMGELSDSDADELAGDVTVPAKRTVIRVGDSIGRFKNGEKGHVTNAVLISGPSGCGKTASVYAVAKELDFKVFEINSATRRSARDILERVGDMTQNHLVQRVDDKEGTSDSGSLEPVDDKQRSMTAFFKAQPSSSSNKQNGKTKPTKGQEIATTTTRTQKQSLILLEEADILFEEDKQFWAGVTALIEQSKRPVIITCNDESLIPLQDLSLHAIFRYRSPPVDLAVDYLLLIAANEGHLLRREAVKDLYLACGHDLRKSLMELNFWCQMAVGSTKSGIDWILDRWTKNEDCRRQRVVSADTYRQYMGWLGRDMLVDSSPLDKETELILEKLNWWNLDMADSRAGGWDSSSLSVHSEKYKDENRVHRLQDVAALTDSWSVFDLLSRSWSLNPEEDILDPSIPELPEKQRASYTEGYALLHADTVADYTGLPAHLGSTMAVLMRRLASGHVDDEASSGRQILDTKGQSTRVKATAAHLATAFDPIICVDRPLAASGTRPTTSFENGFDVVVTDLAPYIRSIVSFDLRLEQYRRELSDLLSDGRGKRKARTTRASRAALEGGSKHETRRDRWFSPTVNASQVLSTGKKEWQDFLVQLGHFLVGSTTRRRRESVSESSESSA